MEEDQKHSKKNILVVSISVLFTISLGLIFLWGFKAKGSTSQFNPTMGNPKAEVKLVLFEDFTCGECMEFAANVLPKIIDEYVSTGQVYLEIYPLAITEESEPVNAIAYCIFNQNKDEFWTFFKEWTNSGDHQGDEAAAMSIVQKMGHKTQNTNFEHCLTTDYKTEALMSNLRFAERTMPQDVEVPAIFVNGQRLHYTSLKAVQSAINRELQLQGLSREQY